MISAEVVYALTTRQTIAKVQLAEGATVRDAIMQSGVLEAHPELALEYCEVAVWGKITGQDRVLRDRDRVEICRMLQADPKAARRKRGAQKRR